jgi:hypothetical protein
VTEGVAGQPPHETTGSNKIANAAAQADALIAIGAHTRQMSCRARSQVRNFERIIRPANQLVCRIDLII